MHFSSHIERLYHWDLVQDLLADAAARTGKNNDDPELLLNGDFQVPPNCIRANPEGGEIGAGGTLPSTVNAAGGGLGLLLETESERDSVAPTRYRYRLARFEGETALMANLPMARDLVTTTAGAYTLDDDPNTTVVETNFRPSRERILRALALDDTSTTALAKIDQSVNGASQVRIVVNPKVKARK